MDKILTISIAAYNVEKYVGKAIESCLISENMLNKLEIIIVNDGSKDNTSLIAHEYQERYPNVVRVIDKENGGYGSTINKAISCANGKYFKLLDADDQYDTIELEKFIALLEEIDVDMVLTNYKEIRESHVQLKKFCLKEGMIKETFPEIEIVMHAICYQTLFLRKINLLVDENIFYTDTEFVCEPLWKVKTVYYSPLSIYEYNLGEEGQSVSMSKRVEHINDIMCIINRLIDLYKKCAGSNEYMVQVIKRKMADVNRFYIYTLLHMKSKEIDRKKIVAFDEKVKKLDIEIYQMMETKCILFLRNTNYRMCRICSVYLKILEKQL